MKTKQIKISAGKAVCKKHDYAIRGFKLRIYWCFMQLVGYHYGNKLGDSGKKQISVQCFFVLCFTSRHTKTVLEVVDGFFYIYSDFISGISFPLHFGTDKFHGWESATQMGFTAFTFHGKGKVFRTTGDAIRINAIIASLNFELVFQGNVSFLKGSFL